MRGKPPSTRRSPPLTTHAPSGPCPPIHQIQATRGAHPQAVNVRGGGLSAAPPPPQTGPIRDRGCPTMATPGAPADSMPARGDAGERKRTRSASTPPPPRHRPRGWPRPHRQTAATVVALTTPEPNRRSRFPLTHATPPPARSARARTSGVSGRPDPVRAPHATIPHLPPPSLPPPSPESPQQPPPPRPPPPPPPPTSYGPRLRR